MQIIFICIQLMSKKEQRKNVALFCIVGVIVCFLIGLFVQSIVGKPKDVKAETKYFGLMNNEITNPEGSVTDSEQETQSISVNDISRIPDMIDKYLGAGDLASLDKYLRGIIEQHKDSDDLLVSIDELEMMRADIAMTINMNSASSESLMQSYRNPKMLAAAMVYEPISCKYKSLKHGDSLMLPAQRDSSILLSEIELNGEEKDIWLQRLNQSNEDVIYTDVKVYSCELYGCEFRFVIGYRLNTATWGAYLIYSDDERTKGIFQTALEMQRFEGEGLVSEETMDTALIYLNLDEGGDE